MMHYKIVQVWSGVRLSCCLNYQFPDQLRVTYEVGKFVTPILLGSKLFVFDDRALAEKWGKGLFYGHLEKGEIWSCEVTNPSAIEKMAYIYSTNIRDFWNGIKLAHYMEAPQGTVAVDSVKLIEKVGDL